MLTASRDQGLPAAATVSGSAADLDCWLWHRSSGAQLERSGDQEVLRRFEAAIAPGVNQCRAQACLAARAAGRGRARAP